jgi:hypothetical protein
MKNAQKTFTKVVGEAKTFTSLKPMLWQRDIRRQTLL